MSLRLLLSIVTVAWLVTRAAAQPPAAEPPLTPVVQRWLWSSIQCMAQSPDGKFLLIGNGETVKFWNATGDRLRLFPNINEGVHNLDYSDDGKTLLISGGQQTYLWNMAANTKYPPLDTPYFNRCACLSPDGKLCAAGMSDRGDVNLWDVATGKLIRTMQGHDKLLSCALFSSDGQTLYTGGQDHLIIAWDVATGKQLRTLKGHGNYVQTLSLSKDSKLLVSTQHSSAILWNPLTGEQLQKFGGNREEIHAALLSADGRQLLLGWEYAPPPNYQASIFNPPHEHRVVVMNPAKNEKLNVLTGHADRIEKLYIGPDNKTLISVSRDRTIFWDWPKGTPLRSLRQYAKETLGPLTISGDRKTMALRQAESHAILWNLATGERLKNLEFELYRGQVLALSHDGKLLFDATSNKMQVFNTATGAKLATWQIPDKTVSMCSIRVSSDGKAVYTGMSQGGAVLQWNVAKGEIVRTLHGHANDVRFLELSADGQTLASGSTDQKVVLWNTTNGQKISDIRCDSGIRSIRLNRTGKLVAIGTTAKTAEIWDVAQGAKLHTFDCPQEVSSVIFSTDEKSLFTNTTYGTQARWEIATGKQLYEVKHAYPSDQTELLHDGKLTISYSPNYPRLHLCDTETGVERLTIELENDDWIARTPANQFDGSPQGLRTLAWLRVGDSDVYENIERHRARFIVPKLLGKILRGETIPTAAVPPAPAKQP